MKSHAIKHHHFGNHSRRKNGAPALMSVIEAMLAPWRGITPLETWKESWAGLTPLEAWIENQRTLRKDFPHTQHSENDEAYFYHVALPHITHEQISLKFHNGSIVLTIGRAESQHGKSYSSQHSRCIRRAFTLPVHIDGKAIKAVLREGMLTITIPKNDIPIAPKAKSIDIE